MSGIILLSSKGKAPGLLRLRLATPSLLAMTGEKTFYETINIDLAHKFLRLEIRFNHSSMLEMAETCLYELHLFKCKKGTGTYFLTEKRTGPFLWPPRQH